MIYTLINSNTIGGMFPTVPGTTGLQDGQLIISCIE